MAYTLEFEKAAIRSLKKLTPQVAEHVEQDIRQLCQQPAHLAASSSRATPTSGAFAQVATVSFTKSRIPD
jgi:hypothetical protein